MVSIRAIRVIRGQEGLEVSVALKPPQEIHGWNSLRLRLTGTLLVIYALTLVAGRGAEANAATMREKLQAKILESLPPPPPPKPAAEQKVAVEPAVVMKPLVVSESKLIRDVTAAIDREEQNRREEPFSVLDGGKIYNIGRLRIGSWWSPEEGWTFLRLNKGPSRRQTEAMEARLKELQELANLAEKRNQTP